MVLRPALQGCEIKQLFVIYARVVSFSVVVGDVMSFKCHVTAMRSESKIKLFVLFRAFMIDRTNT